MIITVRFKDKNTMDTVLGAVVDEYGASNFLEEYRENNLDMQDLFDNRIGSKLQPSDAITLERLLKNEFLRCMGKAGLLNKENFKEQGHTFKIVVEMTESRKPEKEDVRLLFSKNKNFKTILFSDSPTFSELGKHFKYETLGYLIEE